MTSMRFDMMYISACLATMAVDKAPNCYCAFLFCSCVLIRTSVTVVRHHDLAQP